MNRLNRREFWLFVLGAICYAASVVFRSEAMAPSLYSAAYSDMQSFFRGAAILFSGTCIGVICTKHSIASLDKQAIENSLIYAVRALYVLAFVLIVK